MKKTAKKGFTIVELVIVIAVIAILAAVLIPTFVSLVNKANNSADTQMVANINKYLAAMELTDGKNETMADALEDIADAGYNATVLANATNTILWDLTTDRVMAVDGSKTLASADGAKYDDKDVSGRYWIVAAEYDSETNYSYYLMGKATIPTDIKYGLDISSLTFESVADMPEITYIGTGANVVLNGEFQSVTINCTNADANIRLYGFVSKLTLTEGKLEVNGFVSELDTNVLPNNENGSAFGGLTANYANFHQKQTEISSIMKFKTFTDNGSKYEQHYFGANNDLQECLCCESNKAVNPNHICVTGEVTTETRDDGTYLVIKCAICEKKLVDFKIVTTCSEHNWENGDNVVPATCTTPGYRIKYCTQCGTKDVEEIPALGHLEVAGEGKAATCTEAGLTNGKYCTRCSTEGNRVWTESQVEIPALGHDYNRTTGKCTRCGGDQPTVKIDANILHSKKTTAEDYGTYTSIGFNGYESYMDRVIFGYKEDYIHSINGTKVVVEHEKYYEGVEIYVVYKQNPNYGKVYDEKGAPTDRNQPTGDQREFLVDYYVLSDSRMCYVNEYDSDICYGFASGLGTSVMYYYKNEEGNFQLTYHLAGAVKEIRFENFDTSDIKDFDAMFLLCQVQKLDLSKFIIDPKMSFNGIFDYSNFREVIYPQNWPEDAKAELITEGWE